MKNEIKIQNYPCRKLVQLLLLIQRKIQWETCSEIEYPQFMPDSKKFMSKWIVDNLHGPTQIMATNAMDNLICPITLESRYKELCNGIWIIIDNPSIREQVELGILFGNKVKEIHQKVLERINPRKVSLGAIKQFKYYFWNIEDDNEIPRPAKLIELLQSNRALSKAYNYIYKYYNNRYGHEQYEYYYNLKKSDKPNIDNISKVIDLSVIEQMQSLSDNNLDRLITFSSISLNSAKTFSIIKQHSNEVSSLDLSSMITISDKKPKSKRKT